MISAAAYEIYHQRRQELASRIIERPEEFDMATWGQETACGTTACLAGTAVMMAAEKGLCEVSWDRSWGGAKAIRMTVKVGKRVEPLSFFAQQYLGLESWGLFYGVWFDAEEAAKKLLDEPYSEGPFTPEVRLS